MGITAATIHAERSQEQRDKLVRAFREGTIPILICTELMGRGVDFKAVNQGGCLFIFLFQKQNWLNFLLVINYDCPTSKFTYIHHIGRTGRAGRKGTAITFYTHKDSEIICPILTIMRLSGAEIPEHLKNFNRR